jgi:quinoprotein glucose dehydrogenase
LDQRLGRQEHGPRAGRKQLEAIFGVEIEPNYVRLMPRAEADKAGVKPRFASTGISSKSHSVDPQWGVPWAIDVNAGWRMPFTKLMCKRPPYGGIRAIDIASGKTLWDHPFGTARANGPFNVPTGLPFTIGTPNTGGAVTTAGGLVFIAASTDNLLRALDLRTGETLWTTALPAGGQATPIVYQQDGREYVVIFAGGHHFMETPEGDSIIAYALP